ncbi:MAG: Gmad2 immunoglobulin-like domain-containing protein [Patescibacteria group bacterium]
MKKIYLIFTITSILITSFYFFYKDSGFFSPEQINEIKNFKECALAGYPILESYPRQCRADNKTFIEEIEPIIGINEKIRVEKPMPNDFIESPLQIKGEARGFWFFEASFPIRLLDGNSKEIAIAIAQAQSEWMTTEFVPFEAMLEFKIPDATTGTIIFKKDNPSGLPEYDDELRMPVKFTKKETIKEFGIIKGKVLLGPVCPVMRIPSDPNCNDKPYPTNIEVFKKSDLSKPYKIIETDETASFEINLEQGVYILKPQGKNPLPRCAEKELSILSGKIQEIEFSCDTGIR